MVPKTVKMHPKMIPEAFSGAGLGKGGQKIKKNTLILGAFSDPGSDFRVPIFGCFPGNLLESVCLDLGAQKGFKFEAFWESFLRSLLKTWKV